MKKTSKQQQSSTTNSDKLSTVENPNPSPLQQNNLKHIQQSTFVRPKLKQSRNLSLPLFSIAHSGIITCRVIGPMFEGDMDLGDRSYDSKPTLCPIINFDEDGKEGWLICNAVIKSTLEKIDGGYIDKIFQFRDGGPKEGKKYRTVDISLMEEE